MTRRHDPPPLLKTDWRQASRYYQALHGTNPTEFRFIKRGSPTISLWGDLAKITDPDHRTLKRMTRLNSDGYGAYMVVNTPNPTTGHQKIITDGKGSITDTDIVNATAFFVELDHDEQHPGSNYDLLAEAELKPSLIIQSSLSHKLHAYWLVVDCGDMNLWRRLQAQLIAKFGGDPACKNPSRVMRIPGFWHTKAEPIQSRILLDDPQAVYTLADIIDIFQLDPELEVYSELPANATPDDWLPPTGITERLLERAERQARKVAATDVGRHRSLLWLAMSCRENNLPRPQADQLATRLADLLPPRKTGPIPHHEATAAIDWAYQHAAGKNPPLRGTITINQEAGGETIDDLAHPAAHAPITIQNGGYAHVKDTQNGPIYRQLTNWVFTPTTTLEWPDGTIGHRGTLAINTNTRHTIDLPAKAWSSRRDLLNEISSHNAVIFTNSNSDIAYIRQFILTNSPTLPTARGVTTYGLHNLNGAWEELYQDTLHDQLFYAGTPVDPGPAYRALRTGTLEQIEAARQTIRTLLTLITPSAAMALIGYGLASTFSPRVTPQLGDRLPFLYITGERESGKSSSIELILALTTSHSSARLRKAPNLTPYQYDSSFANMNNRLAALDEYRPGSIDDSQLRKHHDLGVKWRGSGIAAKDHAYILNSPLIVAGEGFTEDAAALSRGPLYFILQEDRGDTQTYLSVQAAPNWAYAAHLTEQARCLPEEEHQERFKRAHNLAKAATNARGGPRLEFALTFIAYGLLHAQEDVDADLFNDKNIQLALEVGVQQTLEGGDESKTNLETFLEQLGSAAGESKDPSLVLTPGALDGTLIIRVSAAVELVRRRYGKDAAISNARLLRQYASKLKWVDASSTHKSITGSSVRGIRIYTSLAPARCDLGALEYLDEQLRRAAQGNTQQAWYGGSR